MASGSSSDLPRSDKAQRLAKEWAQNPHSKVFVPLAEEYAKLGMLQRAAMVLEEGIGHYPGYVIAMVALGAVYFEMKEVESAKDVLEAAIQSSPENMKAHRVLAQIYAAEGNVDAARRSCTVVLMTNPLDEEIKSLERSLGGAPLSTATPVSKKRAVPHQAERPVAVSAPSGTPDVAPVEAPHLPGLATIGGGASRISPHARQIARLERWLAQIQSARRTA